MSQNDAPEPFVINPNALYPLDWLERRLAGIITVRQLMDRTGLKQKRKFRDCVVGSELLRALEQVGPYDEAGQPGANVVDAVFRGRGNSHGHGSKGRLGRIRPQDVCEKVD
jgi:hypothetical protein